jgi:hypothetical protein
MPLPSDSNRKSRRKAAEKRQRRHTRAAALTGVALTAAALTAAIAPPATPTERNFDVALAAAADPILYPMFGVGPLGDLL